MVLRSVACGFAEVIPEPNTDRNFGGGQILDHVFPKMGEHRDAEQRPIATAAVLNAGRSDLEVSSA